MSLFTLIASSKLAASAVALGTLTIGGVGTAAYAGALPEPAQQAAHQLIGAPAPSVEDVVAKAPELPSPSASASPSVSAKPQASASAAPVGADALGVEAAALCKAYGAGGLDVASVAYRNLSAAAQGEANIGAYCEAAGTSKASVGAEAKVEANAEAGVTLPEAPKTLPSLPAEAAVPTAPALPSAPAVDAKDLPAAELSK